MDGLHHVDDSSKVVEASIEAHEYYANFPAHLISKLETLGDGFVILPMSDPATTAKDLGSAGALDNHLDGQFYDNECFYDSVALALSAYGWAWHDETGLHILKLFASGLFDRSPKLKIAIGHMGEMLQFQQERFFRITEMCGKSSEALERLLPLGHVLYSVDYPFSSNEDELNFIEEIKHDFDLFAFKMAENLLGVTAASL
ncbi:hypothetical protein V1511DRAFT_520026 [Dipodascopsis uninucleata]